MCWHMLITYRHTFWSLFGLLFAYFSRLPSAVKPKMIYQRQTVLVDLHLGCASVASVYLLHTFPLQNTGHPWVVHGSSSVEQKVN